MAVDRTVEQTQLDLGRVASVEPASMRETVLIKLLRVWDCDWPCCFIPIDML